MERRPLAAAVTAVPNANPEAVREFVMQERRPINPQPADLSELPERAPRAAESESTRPRRRSKAAGVTPIGLIPVTVRLRPEIAGALKRASLERQLSGEELFTQQDLVEQALAPWLRSQGFLN